MFHEKRLAPFTPLPRELEAVEGYTNPYHDNFRLAIYSGKEEGRRILIVSDRVSKTDIETGEILSGDECSTFENALKYAIQNSSRDVKEVTVFNWQFASVHFSGKKNKQDITNEQKANEAFFMRFKRFVKRYKPDEIVVSGIETFEYIAQQCTGDVSTPHRIYFNRRVRMNIDGVKYPITGTLDYFRMCSWDTKYTKDFPFMLGFFTRALVTAFNGKNAYTAPNLQKEGVQFHYINTLDKFKRFFSRLCRKKVVALDTEGLNLAKYQNRLFCIQFAWSKKHAYLVPLDHPDTPFSPKELRYIKRKLQWYFEFGQSRYHIYHYAKFDVTVLFAQLGVRFYNHRVYDTQAGEYALDENRKLLKNFGFRKPYGPYSLGLICEHYGIDIYRKIEFSKGDRGNIANEGLTKRFIEYSCYDVIVLLWIVEFQRKEARRRGHGKFMKFVCEQLSDTVLAFSQMELVGAPVNKKQLWALQSRDGPIETTIRQSKYKFRESKAAQRVNQFLLKRKGIPTGATLFGDGAWYFDPDKQQHQQLLFFKALNLEPLKELKNGDGQVNKAFQQKYKDVPEVALFNTYKKNLTIRNTSIAGISDKLANDPDCKADFRIRSSYDYTEVVTARSSSRDPNLQNLPSHGDLAKPIKSLFICTPGCLLVENDYSAHEVRDWANESGDKAIAAAFYKGLKYRQELRIAAYSNDEAVVAWTQLKKETGWDAIKGDKKLSGKDKFEKLQTITKEIKVNGIKFIATIELDIEVNGDVHKLNCERFFKVSVLEVSDEQRQGVKAVVFGVIYGKGAASLGESLNQTEEYAQNLIDTMFREFRAGGEWIEGIHDFGQRNFYVESPLGMHRHLWGYMHTRKAVVNAMNRRGPNTIIQGMASNIGVSSIRLMQKMGWHFFVKHDVPYHWKSTTNYVHDSVKGETKIHTVPLYLYLIEHASTTQIHKRYRELYDYKLTVGLELEFQIGASLARSKKWNFMRDSLFDQMSQEIDYCKTELGHEINKDRELKWAAKNWEIVSDLRRRELEEAVKKDTPAELMLMNEKNARSLGLIIH